MYLDHAATTPMLPEALAAMTEELAQLGNPSSLHNAGRRARRVVEESREQIAEAYGARPSEVVFTSGGTEADNLAVKGLYWARRAADPARRRVLATADRAPRGAGLRALAGRARGRRGGLAAGGRHRAWSARRRCATPSSADPASVALVSVMWANNEVGTVQPIAELAAVAREYGSRSTPTPSRRPGSCRCSLAASGADALTITAHKIGGPVGVGALLLARGVAAGAGAARRRPGARRPVRHPGRAGDPGFRGRRSQVATERRDDEAKRLAGCATT